MLAQILRHLPFLPGMDHRAWRHILPQWWVASLRVCLWSVSPDAVGRPVGPIFAGRRPVFPGRLSVFPGRRVALWVWLAVVSRGLPAEGNGRQPVVLSTGKSPASQFVAWTQGTSLMVAAVGSAHGAFERDGKQFLCFDGKLHGEFVEHILCVTVDDEVYGRLCRDAALVAVE